MNFDDNSITFDMNDSNITRNHGSNTQNSILINDFLNNCQFCNNNNEKLFRYLKD